MPSCSVWLATRVNAQGTQVCLAAPNCYSLVMQDKISSITVDEVLASDPEIATAIDEDIKKGDFLP